MQFYHDLNFHLEQNLRLIKLLHSNKLLPDQSVDFMMETNGWTLSIQLQMKLETLKFLQCSGTGVVGVTTLLLAITGGGNPVTLLIFNPWITCPFRVIWPEEKQILAFL